MNASPARVLPLELRDLSFRYGRKVVLRSVDLSLHTGEVVALLGANGAGKTTLFSLLCGLAQPDAGERRFGGELVDDVGEDLRARLAHLGHRPQVYPLLTARENLELFADLRAATGVGRGGDGPALLTRLGLGEVIDQPVSTFSRGMAQRVALARALAQSPDLLVLDEPFTALDPAGRSLLAGILREEAQRGAAILLASHDIETVATVADRALVLIDGVIARRIELDFEHENPRAQMRAQLASALSAPEARSLAAGA